MLRKLCDSEESFFATLNDRHTSEFKNIVVAKSRLATMVDVQEPTETDRRDLKQDLTSLWLS